MFIINSFKERNEQLLFGYDVIPNDGRGQMKLVLHLWSLGSILAHS